MLYVESLTNIQGDRFGEFREFCGYFEAKVSFVLFSSDRMWLFYIYLFILMIENYSIFFSPFFYGNLAGNFS